MKFEIILPIKIDKSLSLNRIYSGIHWAKRAEQAQNIHDALRIALISQKIPKYLFPNPVNIIFQWNSKLDLDNHGYVAKLIIDGLKEYLIYDDTKKYIKSIKHEYSNNNTIKVIISD